MSLRIVRPGLLTTVQDRGRFGLQHLGVVPCGAMDPVALELANGLVGNRNDEAAFTAALHGLLDQVRAQGSPLPSDTLEPSDLILPPEDASMDEVREMLTEEGLIPG